MREGFNYFAGKDGVIRKNEFKKVVDMMKQK